MTALEQSQDRGPTRPHADEESWEYRRWLDEQAADAFHERLCAEDAALPEVERDGTCDVCGRPSDSGECPRCEGVMFQ